MTKSICLKSRLSSRFMKCIFSCAKKQATGDKRFTSFRFFIQAASTGLCWRFFNGWVSKRLKERSCNLRSHEFKSHPNLQMARQQRWAMQRTENPQISDRYGVQPPYALIAQWQSIRLLIEGPKVQVLLGAPYISIVQLDRTHAF